MNTTFHSGFAYTYGYTHGYKHGYDRKRNEEILMNGVLHNPTGYARLTDNEDGGMTIEYYLYGQLYRAHGPASMTIKADGTVLEEFQNVLPEEPMRWDSDSKSFIRRY